ncbi:hypothetical protein, partial [Burkholderia metallica]|uniref:hypothetical protein n=1 Tax=Burkholderia metallica TaxID=488729 RepID=UPI001CF2F2CD
AELLKQLGGNGRQVYRLGFRFARHTSSFGASYALNTKLLTGPDRPHMALGGFTPKQRLAMAA